MQVCEGMDPQAEGTAGLEEGRVVACTRSSKEAGVAEASGQGGG